MNVARFVVCGAALCAAPLFAAPAWLSAQGAPPAGKQGAPPGVDMGAELVAALKATKGCAGVELAMTQSRKSVIFAWFEDKAAALRWYHSDVHQTFMMGMAEAQGAGYAAQGGASGGDGGEGAGAGDAANEGAAAHGPMHAVPDDVPVLCIATVTPSLKPMVPGFPMPISQVSIELYTPLPGGVSLNGRFTPDSIRIEHHLSETLGATAPPTDR